MEGLVGAAIVAAFAAIATTLVGAWASRRFGLPGLARQVDTTQDALIETLNTALAESRTQTTQAKAAAAEAHTEALVSARKRRDCEREIRDLKRDLRDTEAELLDLYRRVGKRPPPRLEVRHRDHVTDGEDEDET